MSTVATAPTSPSAVHEKFSRGPGFVGTLIFIGVLVVGIAYIGWSLSRDLVNLHVTSVLPYFRLGLALFVAIRICKRLPRYRQRRGYRHLHAYP